MQTGFNIDPNKPKDFLFVGSPGAGKTSLALRFPAPYVLDCDDNATPAVQYTGIKDFKYDIANKEDDLITLIPPEKRFAACVKRLNAAAADPTIKTIIIDSLTAFIDIVISEVKRRNGLKDDATMRIQDWGDFANIIRHQIIALKASTKHVIFTAHFRVEKDESDNTWKYMIYMPGQTQFTMSGLFSNVWIMFFDTEGVPGPSQKQVLKVRTIPISKNDFRGAKTGITELIGEKKMDDVIKLLPTLVK